MGGLISGVLGGGSSPGQEEQMRQLKVSREAIQAYRPEAMQARLNALSNMSTAYQGANNALQTMYGGAPKSNPGPYTALPSQPSQRFMGHEMPGPKPEETKPELPPFRHGFMEEVLGPPGYPWERGGWG